MGKISDLTEKTTIHDTDLLPMVDIEGAPDTTKRITWANLKKLLNKIVDPTDQDTLVEAEEDQVTMDVAGVEAFLLSSVGIQTLTKQSGARGYLNTAVQTIPTTVSVRVKLNAEDFDIQNELNSTEKSGAADATEAFELHDADGGFAASDVGAWVWNTTDNTYAIVTDFTDSGQITLDTDIMVNGESYDLYHAIFTATEAGYYLLSGGIYYQSPVADILLTTFLYKNGAIVTIGRYHPSNIQASSTNATTVLYLAANDNVDMRTYHTCGVNETLGNGSHATFFSVSKLA